MVLGVHRGESVDESYRSLNGNKDREKPGLEHRGESGGKIKQNGTGNLGNRVGGGSMHSELHLKALTLDS